MKIECEIDVYPQDEKYTEYCEVSVFGSVRGGYDTVSAAIKALGGYLVRSYPGMAYSLKVALMGDRPITRL